MAPDNLTRNSFSKSVPPQKNLNRICANILIVQNALYLTEYFDNSFMLYLCPKCNSILTKISSKIGWVNKAG